MTSMKDGLESWSKSTLNGGISIFYIINLVTTEKDFQE